MGGGSGGNVVSRPVYKKACGRYRCGGSRYDDGLVARGRHSLFLLSYARPAPAPLSSRLFLPLRIFFPAVIPFLKDDDTATGKKTKSAAPDTGSDTDRTMARQPRSPVIAGYEPLFSLGESEKRRGEWRAFLYYSLYLFVSFSGRGGFRSQFFSSIAAMDIHSIGTFMLPSNSPPAIPTRSPFFKLLRWLGHFVKGSPTDFLRARSVPR